MVKDKPITKKMRFEIFKRDSFTCKYCGRSAPNVILHADHIKPLSKGGKTTLLNLITSCIDCNLGKKDRELSDISVITKQVDQAKLLQEKRDQIKMMGDWISGLDSLIDDQIKILQKIISDTGYNANENGIKTLKSILKKFEFIDVITASKEMVDMYHRNKKEENDVRSWNYCFDKLPSICKGIRLKRENPELSKAYFLKNYIFRKYSVYHTEQYVLDALYNRIKTSSMDLVETRIFSMRTLKEIEKYLNG